jgi:hypothetical protein
VAQQQEQSEELQVPPENGDEAGEETQESFISQPDQDSMNPLNQSEMEGTEMNESVEYNPELSVGNISKGEELNPLDVVPDEEEEEEEVIIEEENNGPDEMLNYSTMDGVKTIEQPDILKAELHEHQVFIYVFC